MGLDGYISGIEADTRHGDQMVVRVDGRIVARITPTARTALGLTEGMAVCPQLADALADADALNRAVRCAARRLNRRALSRAETVSHLEGHGFGSRTIENAVEHLQRLGVIDDGKLGHSLVAETMLRRGAGPALLRQKLLQRRLSEPTVERVIEEALQAQDTADTARKLVAERLVSLATLDEATQRRRLYGMLARRGFDEDLVVDIVDEAIGPEA